MTDNKVGRKVSLVFKDDHFTTKELKESPLADLLFCSILKEMQASLDPKKFRPTSKELETSNTKITPK